MRWPIECDSRGAKIYPELPRANKRDFGKYVFQGARQLWPTCAVVGNVNRRIVGCEVLVRRPGAEESTIDEQGAPIVEGRQGQEEPESDEQGAPIVEGRCPADRPRSADVPRSSPISTRQSKICLPLNNQNSLFVNLRLLRPNSPAPQLLQVGTCWLRAANPKCSSRNRFAGASDHWPAAEEKPT